MPVDDALIRPQKRKKDPFIGPLAVMVSSSDDLRQLCRILPVHPKHRSYLMSRLHAFAMPQHATDFALIGPMIGAPYAAILLEDLIAWGAARILFLGWCGTISPEVNIGDLIIPIGAYIDEGTSSHYGGEDPHSALPSSALTAQLMAVCDARQVKATSGWIWTTDAIYRETHEKIAYFRQQQALAVEMELSALFTIGRFRKVEVAGLLVVSDDLTADHWRPGFGAPEFKAARRTAAEIIQGLCRQI